MTTASDIMMIVCRVPQGTACPDNADQTADLLAAGGTMQVLVLPRVAFQVLATVGLGKILKRAISKIDNETAEGSAL